MVFVPSRHPKKILTNCFFGLKERIKGMLLSLAMQYLVRSAIYIFQSMDGIIGKIREESTHN